MKLPSRRELLVQWCNVVLALFDIARSRPPTKHWPTGQTPLARSRLRRAAREQPPAEGSYRSRPCVLDSNQSVNAGTTKVAPTCCVPSRIQIQSRPALHKTHSPSPRLSRSR
ncbi:hypothetical protein QBC47DRAFT_180231 [Echria macrotheca]|uniref:Uncharacterized protein n=1 Tax=Echria macrotheca TaxID=438768 RepID=A0AAJ0FCE8_9PEZI|nr:hypothetical protein QBC47DRAFT_180231 [Echria macrotheca]